MKQETIGVIFASLVLLATGLVGPIPLSLAIVVTYGLALKLVRRRNVDQKMATALAYLSVGVLGIPMLGLLVFPTSMLPGFGLTVSTEAKVLSRDVGATLIGLGVINWMARNATGDALRALLVGNVVIQALELVVNTYEIAVGDLTTQAAGGLLIHLVLGALFVLAMRSPSSRA